MLVGGGGAWMGFETTRRATSATTALLVWRVPEELVGLAVVLVGELPPVSWTSKLKSREWEAFRACGCMCEA